MQVVQRSLERLAEEEEDLIEEVELLVNSLHMVEDKGI
jgi:hypothetical protein